MLRLREAPLGGRGFAESSDATVDEISWNALNPSVQYGGHDLEQACEFLARFQGADGAPRGLPLDALPALWSVMTSLPRLRVALTDSASGRVIHHHLSVRRWGVRKNRIVQGVFPLPVSEEEYLRGGHRIVRRQVRRARNAGVICASLDTEDERAGVLRSLAPRLPRLVGWVDALSHPPDEHWWVARSADGEPIALAVFVVDNDWALLEILLSTDHAARYLLHTEIVVSLAQFGARTLLTKSPMVLRMGPNLRQFQRMLGYRVAHLVLR